MLLRVELICHTAFLLFRWFANEPGEIFEQAFHGQKTTSGKKQPSTGEVNLKDCRPLTTKQNKSLKSLDKLSKGSCRSSSDKAEGNTATYSRLNSKLISDNSLSLKSRPSHSDEEQSDPKNFSQILGANKSKSYGISSNTDLEIEGIKKINSHHKRVIQNQEKGSKCENSLQSELVYSSKASSLEEDFVSESIRSESRGKRSIKDIKHNVEKEEIHSSQTPSQSHLSESGSSSSLSGTTSYSDNRNLKEKREENLMGRGEESSSFESTLDGTSERSSEYSLPTPKNAWTDQMSDGEPKAPPKEEKVTEKDSSLQQSDRTSMEMSEDTSSEPDIIFEEGQRKPFGAPSTSGLKSKERISSMADEDKERDSCEGGRDSSGDFSGGEEMLPM